MCHLCRKVEALEGINIKATKPIFAILSKLHRHAKPRLGDLWLWRYNTTAKLQTLLKKLQVFAPASALQTIMDDVDKELVHIKNNMPEHPPLRRRGRWDALEIPVTPSQSASARWQRDIEQEARQAQRARGDRKSAYGSGKRSREAHVTFSDQSSSTALEGSDLGPPIARVEQSIRCVDGWFRRSDDMMAVTSDRKDGHNTSMVPGVFGSVGERPKLDGSKVWKKLSTRTSIESSITSMSSTGRSYAYKVPVTRIDGCAYKRPPDKVNLDMRVVSHVHDIRKGKRQIQAGKALISLRQEKAKKFRYVF